ncbi:hypothetical protein HKD37_19G053298 [Glycine soja]
MRASLIHLIQHNKFHGLDHEDSYAHLTMFVRICNTVKINQMDYEFIRVSLFPFSLEGNVENWYEVIPSNLSWDCWISRESRRREVE